VKKIVIDECLSLKLRHCFPEHECVTVQYLQARGLKDGNLLERLAGNFDVLITRDGDMRFQQNPKSYPELSVISLVVKSGSIKALLPLVPMIQTALRMIKPGQWLRIPPG
jgi:predicted nuclease of predicted toxin-antitoxin system